MLKFLKYFFLILFTILWFLGCSKSVSNLLFEAEILQDDYRYGDLYRLSSLDKFKELKQKCNKITPSIKQEFTIYLAGDSYTEPSHIANDDFIAPKIIRGEVAEPNTPLKLVKGKKILIIETVERHFRERFNTPWRNWDIDNTSKQIENKDNIDLLALKMPYNEELHQAVLFGSDFWMKVKEIKAAINYKLFDKLDEKVVLSKDGEHILYSLDINPGISSSFDEISEEEIDLMIKNINLTKAYYKSIGFDEVILSIIPNKTTLLGQDLGYYNHLLERIEKHPDLSMPFVSVFEDFMKNASTVYEKGDTHWGCLGKNIWLNKMNAALAKVQ